MKSSYGTADILSELFRIFCITGIVLCIIIYALVNISALGWIIHPEEWKLYPIGEAIAEFIRQIRLALSQWFIDWTAKDEFYKLENEQFIVKYHPNDKPLAEDALVDAGNGAMEIQKWIKYWPRTKILITIFNKQETKQGVAPAAAGYYSFTLEPYGVFIQPTNINTASYYNIVITHELTHLNLHHYAGYVIIWGNEGLAEYIPDDKPKRLPSYVYSLQELSLQSTWNLGNPSVWVAYGESYTIMDFIVTSYNADKLKEVITLVGRRFSMLKAIEMALGLNPEQFEELWSQFVSKQWQ